MDLLHNQREPVAVNKLAESVCNPHVNTCNSICPWNVSTLNYFVVFLVDKVLHSDGPRNCEGYVSMENYPKNEVGNKQHRRV